MRVTRHNRRENPLKVHFFSTRLSRDILKQVHFVMVGTSTWRRRHGTIYFLRLMHLVRTLLLLGVLPGPTLGLEGVTVVDAWDSTGMPQETFAQPVEVSMVLPVSLTCELAVVLHRPVYPCIHTADRQSASHVVRSCYVWQCTEHQRTSSPCARPCRFLVAQIDSRADRRIFYTNKHGRFCARKCVTPSVHFRKDRNSATNVPETFILRERLTEHLSCVLASGHAPRIVALGR